MLLIETAPSELPLQIALVGMADIAASWDCAPDAPTKQTACGMHRLQRTQHGCWMCSLPM